MPRPSKPWFWKRRKSWYCTIRGERIELGPERDKAVQTFYDLMSKPKKKPIRSDSVAVLVDQFLEWLSTNRRKATYGWYRERLQVFCRMYPDLTVAELRPFHVQKWMDDKQVASGTKRNYARSIMRCMKWAEEQGYIEKSPIANFKKPRGGVRQTIVDPKTYKSILSSVKRQPFRDLITFAWETGARASECLDLEARHVEKERVVFSVEEEKMERIARVIYLTPVAEEILLRLTKKHPRGKLFRNTDGKAWTTDAVNCDFVRLEKKLGTKYCLTSLRHSFCHRLLKAGVDALTVSVLMGHSGVSMVAKVYSHMNHAPEYLKESLLKARAADVSSEDAA